MGVYYTDEAKAKLIKGVNLVLDDIRELWNAANYKGELKFNCIYKTFARGIKRSTRTLCINDKKIFLHHWGSPNSDVFILEKRNPIGKGVTRLPVCDYDLMHCFLNEYEGIRKELEAEIKEILHGSDLDFDAVDAILKKYDKEASIEINMPTQNQQQIKVDYVDGKTVGVLDFGDITIKIVTNGSIVLVDKDGVIKAEAKSKIKI